MLPDSRNETYTTATPINPNTLNDLQDAVVAGSHATRVLTFSPILGGGNASVITSGATLQLADAGVWNVPLGGFHAGERIKSVSVAIFGDGVSDLNWNVQKVSSPSGTSSPAGSSVVNPPAAWNAYVYDIPDVTMADGDMLVITFDGVGAGIVLGPITVTCDCPL